MIVDSATIEVRSGRGGDGAVSFRREKYVPKGGPDGGDGGVGGAVVLLADPGVQTLLDLAGHHHWRAEPGGAGRSKQQAGKTAEDMTVRLPVGTLVYDADRGELLADLDAPGKRFVAARGGKGGRGNERFKSPTNQTPRQSTPGEAGEERSLRLELKLIADVGLVGLPNAGKSTLLARVSRATPKVADYPFTTLEPQLGIAELGGSGKRTGAKRPLPGGGRLVIADLPGLIADAHAGSGLGTRFLRHIERTRLLVHVLDAAAPDGSDPAVNYRTIREELARYAPSDAIGADAEGGAGHGGGLADKTELIALSKMDLLGDAGDQRAAVQRAQKALGKKIYPISAATGEGVEELLQACWSHLRGQDAGGPGDQEPKGAWGNEASRG